MTDNEPNPIPFPLDRVADTAATDCGPGTLLDMSDALPKADKFFDQFRKILVEGVFEPERERLKNQNAELGVAVRQFSANEALRLRAELARAEALDRAIRAFEKARAEILTENRELKRIIATSGDPRLMREALEIGARMDDIPPE